MLIYDLVGYLLYNLCLGLFFAILFYKAEKGIRPHGVFFLLLFFPVLGLGRWRFHQKMKMGEVPNLPQKWFVYHYFIRLNWGFIVVVGILIYISFKFFLKHDHQTKSDIATIFVGIFEAFAYLCLLFGAALYYLFLWVILIFLPGKAKDRIEIEVYKRKIQESNNRPNP